MAAADAQSVDNRTARHETASAEGHVKAAWKRILPVSAAGLLEVLAVFVVVRVVLLSVAAFAAVALPFADGEQPSLALSYIFAKAWSHWDGDWYAAIALKGYWFNPLTREGSVAFFPLYPFLVRALNLVVPDVALAGVLVSNACFLLALVCLRSLASRLFDPRTARYAIVLAAAFPFAFFYTAVYTESLFLLLATASFLAAERDRWWLAGLAGMLCAMTRLVGVALAPALLVLYFVRIGWRAGRLRPNVLAISLVPLGLLLFMGYLHLRFGDAWAFYNAALGGWQRYNVFVEGLERLNPLSFVAGDYDIVYSLNFAIGVVFLAAVILVWRVVGPAYAVFSLIAAAIPFSSGLESLGRYMAVVFPVYVAVARCLVQHPLALRLLAATSAALLGLLSALFANGYWIV